MSSSVMRTPEAARYIAKSASWLNKSRLDMSGPPFMRLGSTVVYAAADLDAWMRDRLVAANDNARTARAAA
jgi:predicted DNA-binding transcriptional regulator AlpA